jgi:hypothetical protein
MRRFDPYSFVREHLDGLSHGFEAVLREQLDSFVGDVNLELWVVGLVSFQCRN